MSISSWFSSSPAAADAPAAAPPSAPSSSSTPKPPSSPSLVTELNPEGLKPCCACPDTKSKRDQCFMNSDNAEVDCKAFIEAHRACMLGYGFKV